MDDVDDEFLALVGGDDASDEETENVAQSHRAQSEEPEGKGKSAPVAKSRQRAQDESDEEEGEASSIAASPVSDESASMDESDSESESPVNHNANHKMEEDEPTEPKYPVEGIYASEAEKEAISAMPELEREQLIAKRKEDNDRERQNILLRQLLHKQEGGGSSKKRKAGTVDIEDVQRKTSRQRTKIGGSKVGETSAGIASLRRARAEKSDRQRRREEDRERTKGRPSTRDSAHDDDARSDPEWPGGYGRKSSKSSTPEKKVAPPAELRDFERVRLSRSRFAEVCFHPGFDEAIAGCYCRVAISQAEYQMGVIKSFTQGKPYAMQKMHQAQGFVTDQYVKIAFGKTVKEFPFIFCSDSPFTEAEFQRYQKVCQEDGVPFPKRAQLDAKIDDINALRNRTWTEKEVSDRLKRVQGLKDKYDSSGTRNFLLHKLEQAKASGDEARSTELQRQLDNLSTPKLAFRTSLVQEKKPTPSAPSQQDRLAQLNIQRRRENIEAVRRAQIMERAKARKFDPRVLKGEVKGEDVKLSQEAKESSDHSATPADTAEPTGNAKAPAAPHLQMLRMQKQLHDEQNKKGIPQIHRPIVADDIIAAIDMEIDVVID